MWCDGNRRGVGEMSGGACGGAIFSPILLLLCITIHVRSAIKGYASHTKSGILSRFLYENGLLFNVIKIVVVISFLVIPQRMIRFLGLRVPLLDMPRLLLRRCL